MVSIDRMALLNIQLTVEIRLKIDTGRSLSDYVWNQVSHVTTPITRFDRGDASPVKWVVTGLMDGEY